MAYWLLKSEPQTWSWQQQYELGEKGECWDGVRNYQAAKNMRAMKKGDLAFFYQSGRKPHVIGIVEICREYYIDPTDSTQKFVAVDVRAVKELPKVVFLKDIKENSLLRDMILLRQSRLSVMPVTAEEWKVITGMAQIS